VTVERTFNNNAELSIKCEMRTMRKEKGSPKASYDKVHPRFSSNLLPLAILSGTRIES
jgi:hypothetical protein